MIIIKESIIEVSTHVQILVQPFFFHIFIFPLQSLIQASIFQFNNNF